MKQIRRRGGVFQALAAFVAGAAIGGLASLLYAPASGQVTRRRLAMKLRTLRRETGRRLGQTGRALQVQAHHVQIAARQWLQERMHTRTNGRHIARRTVRHAHAS